MNLLQSARQTLVEAEFSVETVSVSGRDALVFENDTSLGFLLAYPDAADLFAHREGDARQLIARYTPELRASDGKAWNTYVVWLAGGAVDAETRTRLAVLEEDLSGTRKIAEAGLATASDVEGALLNLLPLQSPPRLGKVDIEAEIRERTTEVDRRAVDAFFSSASADHVARTLQTLPS